MIPNKLFLKFIPPYKRQDSDQENPNRPNFPKPLDLMPSPVLSEKKSNTSDMYYSVIYWRKSFKKKKTSEDGVLVLNHSKFELQDIGGRKVTERSNVHKCQSLRVGEMLSLGTFEVEVQYEIFKEDYISGRCYFSAVKEPDPPKPLLKKASDFEIPADCFILDKTRKVFVDKFLSEQLRPHQKIGVKFMYECIAGVRGDSIKGCILADAMGLGKTLQTIALLHTVLRKDSPYTRIARKAVIIAPCTLLNNWKEEFKKWLGSKLCPVVAIGSRKDLDRAFKLFHNGNSSLLIISYDIFRNFAEVVGAVCDIVVCDEGHRLKNPNCKTTRAIAGLKCKSRILLTGTPLQNNLSEFYSCVSLVNPGILGSLQTFNRLYTEPILKAQDPVCPPAVKELAWGRSAELSRITSTFILRRTGDLLESILPKRSEFVVFVKLDPLQLKLYQLYLDSKVVRTTLETGFTSNVLGLITDLRKIVNHPDLIYYSALKETELREIRKLALNEFPETYSKEEIECSYKFVFVERLAEFCQAVGDKIVIVSNFTKTLDALERICTKYTCLRLDGKTSIKARMKAVYDFNHYPHHRIFLLSSKAGGCGLNLIGANRLVLIDPDWNPSNDKQAMARIWRDGQTKEVFIYRLLATGTIDEKIYQRQIAKEDLSSIIVDSKQICNSFSKEYLKELFSFSVQCQTFSQEDLVRHPVFELCSEFIDVAREIQPDWQEEVIDEELNFSQAIQGECYKKTLD